MENIELIGLKIKEIRKKKKISQEALAEMVNMNHRSIVRLENQHSIPTIDTLDRIAKALDVNIVDFFATETTKSRIDIIKNINVFMEKMSDDELKNFYKAIYYFIN